MILSSFGAITLSYSEEALEQQHKAPVMGLYLMYLAISVKFWGFDFVLSFIFLAPFANERTTWV
jgi:hypothetical protein